MRVWWSTLWLVVCSALGAAACSTGASNAQYGIERRVDTPAVRDPMTAFEWDLRGTWEVDHPGDGRPGLLSQQGAACHLGDLHLLRCSDRAGAEAAGWWLADVDPNDPDHGWITYVLLDRGLAGSIEIERNGDRITIADRPTTAWIRTETPDRHKRPTELTLNWFEQLVTGSWQAVEPDSVLGSACTLGLDRSLLCGERSGSWSARRGINAGGSASIQPQLTVEIDGMGWTRSVILDAAGLHVGADETLWRPAP